MERATTADEALDVANAAGIPAQNVVAGDRSGRIGWTIGGRLPRRVGRDGQTPVASTDPNARWSGFRDPAETPRVVDPADGQVWSANNRVAAGEALALIGLGPYDNGARAGMIRDDLRRLARPATEADLLAIQLDDRGVFFARWQALMLRMLDADALRGRPDRARLRARVEAWGGRASVGSPGYGPVRDLPQHVRRPLTAALLAPGPRPLRRRPTTCRSRPCGARDRTAGRAAAGRRPVVALRPARLRRRRPRRAADVGRRQHGRHRAPARRGPARRRAFPADAAPTRSRATRRCRA